MTLLERAGNDNNQVAQEVAMSLKRRLRKAQLREIKRAQYERGDRPRPPAPVVGGVQTGGLLGAALADRQARQDRRAVRAEVRTGALPAAGCCQCVLVHRVMVSADGFCLNPRCALPFDRDSGLDVTPPGSPDGIREYVMALS
jgi:hypothetical protein